MNSSIFVIFIIAFLKNVSATFDTNSLELIHIIFRHGDRTPDKVLLYPKDPYRNFTFEPVGYGQLTTVGKQRIYNLGKSLRENYKTFLGSYTSEVLEARSTESPRTRASMQLILASLFPPENDLIWNKSINWQPIVFDYYPTKDDYVLANPIKTCPRYKKLYFEYSDSPDGHKLYENFTSAIEYIQEHAGFNFSSKALFELYFTLTMEADFGLELPGWTKKVYPDILRHLAYNEYIIRSATKELKKLSAGFLLKKIINDSRMKIDELLPQQRKLFLYACHEFNISFLMQLLGIYYTHIPTYGEYIILEIHNIDGNRKVKILHKENGEEKAKTLKLSQCNNQKLCSFDKFVEIYQEYLPQNINDCHL